MWDEDFFMEIFNDEDLEQKYENDEEYQSWRWAFVNGCGDDEDEDENEDRHLKNQAADGDEAWIATDWEALANDPRYQVYLDEQEAEASIKKLERAGKKYELH